jgi:hypothetical protein
MARISELVSGDLRACRLKTRKQGASCAGDFAAVVFASWARQLKLWVFVESSGRFLMLKG